MRIIDVAVKNPLATLSTISCPFRAMMRQRNVPYRVAVGCYAMSFQDEEEKDNA
ncbi:MAG: hypothetical protein LBE12_01940 [Planctomycetaceae bacterium]|nr:hypothetical protein [Planctomycetaceae bacterium]